ncbi:uncharacterized protein LOC121776627 [Salvia splendens]|uniref:uncharacterized protein LOC121776627 n=1 Tax=Salvia splendens TaxID=180675 RepID=UPI001C2689AA|nr:uncharacterized protein LOC121776627 [Salvia splendens]
MASDSGSGADGDDLSRRIREEIRAYTSTEINRLMREALQQQQPAVPRPIQHRAVVHRDHVATNQQLFDDYFAEQPRFGDNFIRWRFMMHRDLFMCIVNALERWYKYFRFMVDASGSNGYALVGARVSRDVGQYRLHALGVENCPTAWKGHYTTGFRGKNPTMVLEAVADYRLWI